ncbi:MAG: 16S rRNA methyltransferase [Candidatus Bathyarchaeia archaeon]
MLTIILAESSLELMPAELVDHPVVRRDASRRRKRSEQLLLDRSYHHRAMSRLIDSEKRGRPDIIHITLLTSLGTPLNLMGALRIYVHTLKDWIIDVSPNARIPRNSERFKGLIEQLFDVGRVPPEGSPLLRVQEMTLHDLKRHINPTYTVGLTVKGRDRKVTELASFLVRQKRPTVIIGGFPHGHFTEATEQLTDELVSIYPRSLEAWVVVSELISAYEAAVEGAGGAAC